MVLSAFFAPLLKYIAGGLAILCLVLGIALKIEQRHSAKLSRQVTELSLQLRQISASREAQKRTTEKNIVSAKKEIERVQVVKERIVSAPNPEGCVTPALDEARNVL